MSDLAALHAHYLTERQHAIRSTTPGTQARYVLGEAQELVDSMTTTGQPRYFTATCWEIADVVLAAVTLAKMLGVTVEGCIAAKTAADRGRG
jgi:NTP pyrophosphatase (non-canonical NTP hydrolase)